MISPLDGIEDLVQRELAKGAPPDLAGPIPTLWSADGIEAAWSAGDDLILEARPPAVQLHTWSPGRVAAEVLRLIPGARLLVGCGIDSIARDVALGRWSARKGIDQLLALAGRARDAGAEVVVWNAEASWKRPPSSDEARRLDDLIRQGLAAVAGRYRTLRQWHTSYDHPGYHSTYPWRAWLGPGSPIEASLPQVYAAPEGGLMAHRGALPAREARALASWGAAVRAGWITADDPATPALEGVRWLPYYQAHHVTTADAVASAVAHPLACLWAIPTRTDAAGRAAFRALCELHRRGWWGAGAVQAFQRSAGLTADGICGAKTLRALGIV